MFDPTSRYATLEIATLTVTGADGTSRELRYVRRRFIPIVDAGVAPLTTHAVKQGERLDNLTALYLGDPTQFWRIADVNNVLRPDELTEESGRVIQIALPLL